MAEKLFALSEDTKDKVLELIGRKPAPDKYANKTPVMREYYSRMWLVQLDEDLPGIVYDSSGTPVAQGVDAYVMEKNEDDEIEQRKWNSTQVKLRKQVFNPTEYTIYAKNGSSIPILYTAIQDMLGTIWVQPQNNTADYFLINPGNDGTRTAANDYSVYTKGSLHYVTYSSTYHAWIPASGNEGTPATAAHARPSGTKLVVCQCDAPNSAAEFRMPYFTPESNMGVPPKISSSSWDFVLEQRCGVLLGEHVFTNKMYDYSVNANSGFNTGSVTPDGSATYGYQPRFMALVTVKGAGSDIGTVSTEINNVDYDIYFPGEGDGLSANNYPDIYSGDNITVWFDCETMNAEAIDYPTDYKDGTIMPWFRTASYLNPAYPGRGWVPYVPSGWQGHIAAVNIDKTDSHYDAAGDCIYVEAGSNDKIAVKEGCLCFIEKVKTNAIL